MFNFLKSKPPIIIINEAEHPAPVPVLKEKSWWSKYKGIVFISAFIIHLAAVTVILSIMIGIKENAVNTNTLLLRQLRISDSLFNTAVSLHYNDSIIAQQHYNTLDSINAAAFKALSAQLKEASRQNALREKRYQEILLNAQPETIQ